MGLRGYEHKAPNEKAVGLSSPPPAPVPTNLLVRPLQSPPMERVKDADNPPPEDSGR